MSIRAEGTLNYLRYDRVWLKRARNGNLRIE